MVHTIYTACSRSIDTWIYTSARLILRQTLERSAIYCNRVMTIEWYKHHTCTIGSIQ